VISPQEPWRSHASERSRHGDNWRYASIGYHNVRRILRVVRPGPEDVFYDIGCGMGRILCVAAQQPLRRCVGIELQEPLCEIARRNAARLRRRKAPIEIVRGDATTVDLSDGTIYFMFNPFGPETLRDTLENIRGSHSKNPRPIKLVYYHAKYKSVIDDMEWLVKMHDFDRFGGHPVTIWENRKPEDGHGSHSASRRRPAEESALESWNEAIAINSDRREPWLKLAEHYYRKGDALRTAAAGTDNVLLPMREALKLRATGGEVAHALRDVWGVYQPQDRF